MMLGSGERGGVRVLSCAMHARITHPLTPPGLPTRGLGWDLRPYPESPARGRLHSPYAYGHTGWTGQAVWMDPERGLYVIVLTNRVHPVWRGDDDGSNEARAEITDLLVEAFSGP